MVGILTDNTDSAISVMKLDKNVMETYADIGGLESQVNYRTGTGVNLLSVA